MRKFFSSLLIFSLLAVNISSSFGMEEYTGKYAEYIPKIEEKVNSMSEDEIELFQISLADIIRETDDVEMENFFKSILLLTSKDSSSTPSPILVSPLVEDTTSQHEHVSKYAELSVTEQRNISREITKIQSSFEGETKKLLSEMLSSWNSLSRYTERGNMIANMDMSIENMMKLEAGMNISDYFAQNQSFDSSITADIDGFYNATSLYLNSGEQIDFSGKTNLEFIQKGSESYLLMRNTEFSSNDENVTINLTPMVEKLNELSQNNTFISFGNETGIDPYVILNYFNSDNLEKEIDMFFSQNLMEAYGKNEDRYLLRPTKHLCDMGKRITNVFDPFNGADCSDNQYQNMLEDFMDSGTNITLQTGNEIILSISNMDAIDTYETFDLSLIWRNASFDEMNMSVKDSFDGREYLTLQYENKKLLKISIPEQDYDPGFIMSMNMSRYGGIKNIDISSSYQDEYNFIATYDNGDIDVDFNLDVPELQATCNFSGEAYISTLNISGDCELVSPFIDTPNQSISLTSSIDYKGGTTQNNFSWNFDALSDDMNYLSFNIISEAKREAISVYEIKAPTNTLHYFDFLSDVSGSDYSYYDDYDSNYEITYNEYDDYSETCYVYDTGDTTCYQYYDDKDITCEYVAETNSKTCEEYEYGYTLETNEYDDYSETCYIYDTGDTTCYQYYDDKDVTCEYVAESDTETCEEYTYDFSY